MSHSPDHHARIRAGMLDGDFPPVPEINSLNEEPPMEGPREVIGGSDLRLNMWADADNSSKAAWVNEPNVDMGPHTPYLLSYWDGTPTDYTLTLRRFWRQVPRTYTHVYPGDGFSKEYQTTVGISESDSQTLSAELSVQVGDLGAKIDATFSHTVTTSQEESETTRYDVGGPKEGHVRVWLLWQLVDEIVALGPDGKVIPEERGRGDVQWDHNHTSGAYLHYRKAQQVFPSAYSRPYQKDFPV